VRLEQRALARPGPAGHHDPAIGGFTVQQLIELRQERGAPHEARMTISFRLEIDRPRRLRR
jgi:hypothetical protein